MLFLFCKNNTENLSTTKVGEHILSGFSMSIILWFKSIKNKHAVYRGRDCMVIFCESLREQAIKIINFFLKKLLTKKAEGILWKCKNLLYL